MAPTRAIFETEVNDDAFNRFQANVAKFQEKLKALPGAWGKLDAGVENTAGLFADMTAALLAQTATIHEMAAAERAIEKTERAAAKAKKEEQTAEKKRQQDLLNLEKKRQAESKAMVSNVAGFAKGVAGVTVDLLKWVGIGSIVSGLAGAGGLWGLDTLANNVSNSRRTAMGIGVTTGDLQAAKLTFSRYGDSEGILDNIANLQASPEGWGALQRAGGNINGGVADNFLNILTRGRSLMQDKSRPQGVTASIYGLDKVAPLEFWRAIAAEKPADFDNVLKEYRRNQADFALQDQTNRKWQDFSIQMGRAGRVVENAFIDGLEKAHLPDAFSKLSESVASTIKDFMASPQLRVWLGEFSDGIQNLAKYLASPKFQQDMNTFVTDVGILAKKLVDALVWLKLIPNPGTDTESSDYRVKPNGPQSLNPWDPRNHGHYRFVTNADIHSALNRGPQPGYDNMGNPLPGADAAAARSAFGGSTGNPAMDKVLDGIHWAESRNGRNAGFSSAGAFGDYQFMPGTAAQYGVVRGDPASSRAGAGRYMTDLMKEFHNDLSKALAAYNWGEGNVDRDVQQHGADWMRFAPKGVQDYVRGITVHINNQTGAHVSVQTSQLPQ